MLPANKLKLEKLAKRQLNLSRNSLLDEQQDDLNSTLLRSLECAVSSCHRYLYPPIKQCRSGHCLCFNCSETPRQICLECGAPIIIAKNIALEAISVKVLAACKYRSEGCPETRPLGSSMVSHEKQCCFRLHKCFAAKCSWNGPAHDILEHMECNHKERVFVGSEKVFKIKNIGNRKDMDMMYLFSCMSNEFWVKFIYKEADTSFYGAVQYIGQQGVAKRYTYSFEITTSDNQSSKQYTYTRLTHADVADFEMIFKYRDCFWFPINIAKYLAENDVLSVKVNIAGIGN